MKLFSQFSSCITIIIIATSNGQESRTCKKIEECLPLKNLLREKNNFENITPVEVFDYVRSLQCGETRNMVLCPEGTVFDI